MVKTGAFKHTHTHTQRTHRRLRKERRLIVSTTIFFKFKKKKILPKTFSLFKRGEINWVQYYLSFLNFNLNKVEVCCLSLLCMLGSTCHDTHVEVRGYLWSWCLLLPCGSQGSYPGPPVWLVARAFTSEPRHQSKVERLLRKVLTDFSLGTETNSTRKTSFINLVGLGTSTSAGYL